MRRRDLVNSGRSWTLIALAITACDSWLVAARAAENTAAENRLTSSVQYLASDELEGRGVGTKGLDLAADYIAEQFHQIGLKTDLFDGTPFQKFTIPLAPKLEGDDQNTLSLLAPGAAKNSDQSARIDLKLNTDFSPQSIGGSSKFDLPVVFAGYGITAPEFKYDDYAGLDAKGKAVVIVRHEPQQDDPHSVFDGTADSQYAAVARKIANAYEHGAEAVLLVSDQVEIDKKVSDAQKRLQQILDELQKAAEELKTIAAADADKFETQQKKVEKLGEEVQQRAKAVGEAHDPLFPFTRFGDGTERRTIPVIQVREAAIDRAVKAALGSSLAELEKQIDEGPKPHSGELTGWRISGQTDIKRTEAAVKNVVGVLEGEGPHAEETIVVGAHYDHLGYGGPGSFARCECHSSWRRRQRLGHGIVDRSGSTTGLAQKSCRGGWCSLPSAAKSEACWGRPLCPRSVNSIG